MADTTNIDDLPSVPQNNVVLEKQETPEYQKLIAHDDAQNVPGGDDKNYVPSAVENQKIMNELVAGIQQASASGATQLPIARTFIHKYIPSFFGKDGNQNLGGHLFFSVLFAGSYFMITSIIKKIEIA